jgi:hypothetical protein
VSSVSSVVERLILPASSAFSAVGPSNTIVASGLHEPRAEGRMILFIVFVCLLLWFLGLMTSYTLGGVLHILLVIGIVLFLVHVIQGRSVGNA